MTLYDEYCYNLMEKAIGEGASSGKGIPREECVALMNIMAGARAVESYINSKKIESEERILNGEEMGN